MSLPSIKLVSFPLSGTLGDDGAGRVWRADLWIGSMQALGHAYGLGAALGKRRAPLAFARALPAALASATVFRHQPGLLVLGQRTGDLAHRLVAGIGTLG